MKKILALFLMCFLGLSFSAHATLTATYTPVTKTGGSNPVMQNGSIVDTGTSSGPGNVGIGSANPTQTLDVGGTVRATGFIAGTAGITSTGSLTGQTNYFAANVGIGKNNPAQALDINGTAAMVGFVMNTSPSSGYVLTSDTSGNGSWAVGGSGLWNTANTNDVYEKNSSTYGNVSIGTNTTTTASLRILKNGSTDYIRVDSVVGNSGNPFIITNAGNVGIGSANPGQSLDINGTGRMTAMIATGTGNSTIATNLGIGSANPGQALDITGTVRMSQQIFVSGIATDATKTDATVCEDTTTHQFYSGSGTLGICLGTSSARFKHDISPLQIGLNEVLQLNPVTFFYNKGYGDSGNHLQYGLIAEQVKNVVPNLVALDMEGNPNSVDLLGLVPVIIMSVQQQQNEIRITFAVMVALSILFSFVIYRKK